MINFKDLYKKDEVRQKPLIVFFDPCCPKPYSPETLASEGLGGTESTIVRISEALSKEYDVVVMQHNRDLPEKHGALYCNTALDLGRTPDHVIVLRIPQFMPPVYQQFGTRPKYWLYLHDVVSIQWASEIIKALSQVPFNIICVSRWHRQQTLDGMQAIGFDGGATLHHIYGPIADDLKPDSTPIDKNKLMFTSSPHKGLEYTLEVFKLLRNFNPDFRLHITNPGYYKTYELDHEPNVVTIGVVTHNDVIRNVRDALCVFHLNTVFPETQGLVYQEANAVGTPFLTHGIGAVHESSDHPSQIVDVRDKKKVIDTVMHWYNNGRPRVRGIAEFRLSNVVKKWYNLLKF